jgi:hypothetical protein
MPVNNSINNTGASFTASTGGLTATAGGLTITAGTITFTPLSWGAAVLNASGVMTSQTPGAAGTVLTSTGATSLPTWQSVSGSGMTWSVVTANVSPMAANNGYMTNKAGTACTLTLPTTATVGDRINVSGMGATGWSILQSDAAHQVFFGTTSTTVGATGHLDSTAQYDSCGLVALTTKTWSVITAFGNLSAA